MSRMTAGSNVAQLFDAIVPRATPEDVRIAEAMVFASAEPLDEATIAARLSDGADVGSVMEELQRFYAGRGVNLVRVARRWTFRTAADLSWLLAREDEEKRKLSRAAIETLAIVAYHQPVTRADIEEIRGVAVSKGALDALMEAGWVRMRGRRKAPGRPITYGTTTEFLIHFGLDAISDLPGLDELQAAGLFDGKLPAGYGVPQPSDEPALQADEEPLGEANPLDEFLGADPARRDRLTLAPPASRKRQKRRDMCSGFFPGEIMALRLLAGAAFGLACAAIPYVAWAAPLTSHRAAYDISLADPTSPPSVALQTPVAATGMIAYEFRGSACDGYTSSFRQMTEMERSEGSPIDMDVNASSFEAADGASMQFKIDTRGIQDVAPVAGTATRGANDDVKVELTQPAARTIDFGRDIIFPTQHVEKLIEAARAGGGVVQAQVYDGSDTGAKIYATMAIVGKEATKPSEDAANVVALKDVRRWPVVVSYFNEASKDSAPEYVLSYDLYENGVSGSLKLDYGAFALEARLRKLEILPASVCAKQP